MRPIGWMCRFTANTTTIATATVINCVIAARINVISVAGAVIHHIIIIIIVTGIMINVAVVVVDWDGRRWCRLKIS